nr:hypothetical protein CFP56_15588 [Quercus suber]
MVVLVVVGSGLRLLRLELSFGDPEYFGTFLFTREFPRIKGFGSALYHYINHKLYSSRGTSIGTCMDDQLTDDFCASSIDVVCGKRVISHITVSKTKSCMVLTQSIATNNQESRNPLNALERQVQTLVATVERLTQWNHELERQLE